MLGLLIRAYQMRSKQSCSGQILDFQVPYGWIVRHLSHLALFRLLICILARRGTGVSIFDGWRNLQLEGDSLAFHSLQPQHRRASAVNHLRCERAKWLILLWCVACRVLESFCSHLDYFISILWLIIKQIKVSW